jgi:hypothetical protein
MSKTIRGPDLRWRQLSRAHSTREHGRLKRTAKVSFRGFGEPAAGLFVIAICDDIPGAKAIVEIIDSVLPARS